MKEAKEITQATYPNTVASLKSNLGITGMLNGTIEFTKFRVGDPASENPYGVIPLGVISGPTVLNSVANAVGDGAWPTYGRTLTISGVQPASPEVPGWAIGIDVHPQLFATANGNDLVGIWVDPSGPNGESQFNLDGYSNVRTAGIMNVQSLNQTGYVFLQGNIVGLENGALSPQRRTTGPSNLMSIGDWNSQTNQTFDIGSLSAGSTLYALNINPTLKNTASSTATRAYDIGLDIKVKSISEVANTLTNQVAIHLQDGVVDANTAITNKYGILIESISGGTDLNYGIWNKSKLWNTGQATFAGGTVWIGNSDWSPSTNVGSALRFTMGGTSGNTHSIIQAVGGGNSILRDVLVNPYGGNIILGTTDIDGTPAVGRLTIKGSTSDGSTYIAVGRDSGENNVWSVDTDGNQSSNSYTLNGTVSWTSGAASPESVVTAPVGSIYSRTDGGANTTLYVKESGTGNTGWVAK